jgi:cellulose/xylan binding protein with CBM9 domain
MKKSYILALAATVMTGLSLTAADWVCGNKEPNRIDCEKDSFKPVKLLIGRDAISQWRWSKAHGIGFKKDLPGGELFSGKIAGGKCYFSMKFLFSKPISRFRFVTPRCKAVVFDKGGCSFEYSIDDGKTFHILSNLNVAVPGYKKGGEIAPKTSKWINFTINQNIRKLIVRIVLTGYIGRMYWGGAESNGGIIEYEARKAGAGIGYDIRMTPDNSNVANVYYTGLPPTIFSRAAQNKDLSLSRVEVRDLGRNCFAGDCAITAIGDTSVISLPKLMPGIYELRFWVRKNVKQVKRIALVRSARVLSWMEITQSPFGLKGITRNGRFRKSASIDGPALGRMLGAHQARTGGGPSWVSVCNSGRGQYRWTDPEQKALTLASYGIALRNNLAWTPRWAVDMSRVKKGHWFGHYPPKDEYFKDYAEFCRRSAERNKGIFEPEYEIWNEPNNEPYGSFKGRFEEFVRICKTAATSVKSVDPDAKMILGTTGDSDVGYVYRLLKAGLSKYYSIIDVHPYRHSDRGPEDGVLRDINRLKLVIRNFGDNQDIIFTEVGWPTHIGHHRAYMPVTEFQQACFNSRMLLVSLAGGVKRVHFHMLRDWGVKRKNPEHNFGFIKLNGDPKLTIPAFSTTTRHLERARFIGRVQMSDFYHVWYWDSPWRTDCKLVTAWADTQGMKRKPEWVKLKGNLVYAEDLWGGTPPSSRLIAKKGQVQVLPGADPIFLYIKNGDLASLKPLPRALRPFFFKKLTAKKYNGGRIDYAKLNNKFTIAKTENKTMGYAGIGQEGDKLASSDKQNKKSSFSILYDDKGLYVVVSVKSGRPMKNKRRGWWIWAGDCVRLYLGFDNAAFFGDKQYQVCIAPETEDNGPPQAVRISYDTKGGGAGTVIQNAQITSRNTKDGWVMKAMIPWSFFPKKPQPGDKCSFDISVPGGSWNSSSADKWNNPLRWGQLQFD